MKKLVKLAVLLTACGVARGDTLPASLYVQDGLIGHLDAIENGGAGVHVAAPTEWSDLTGNQTFTLVNGSAFSDDAWVGNSNRYISATSPKALAALQNKAFTLEMVVSHPTESQANAFEYWTYFGHENGNNRNLTMEIRHVNSKNPLVSGLQYRAKAYYDFVKIPETTGLTAWGKRQHLTVVCDGTTATLYCDGVNVLHTITCDYLSPTLATLSFGASVGGVSPLKSGAEICAVRMTERVLTPAEILRNDFLDRVRFMGASATDGATGWRVVNGALQVLTHVGGLGMQFSTDGGTTWQDNALDVWSDVGASVSFSARIAADGSSDVILDALPADATISGGTVSFTAAMPARIVARTATSPATSLYVQDGLIGHLDAIENGGAGVHNASPSTWTDLTGKHAFDCANGAAFSSDAWVGNASRYVKTTSPRALGALMRKAFTLEMVIMHPETPIAASGYEKWAVFGNDSKRQLMVEIRTMNSKNPVIQGLQYRTDGYNHACEVPNGKGKTTAWGRRHCVSVTCDGDSATLYLDGTNAIHTSSYGTVEPTMDIVAFGGYFTGSSPLSAGAEICAVRMTDRVLSSEERQRNRFLDGARFLGESATDGARGYRIVDGAIQVAVSAAGEGVEFSDDGGDDLAGRRDHDVDAAGGSRVARLPREERHDRPSRTVCEAAGRRGGHRREAGVRDAGRARVACRAHRPSPRHVVLRAERPDRAPRRDRERRRGRARRRAVHVDGPRRQPHVHLRQRGGVHGERLGGQLEPLHHDDIPEIARCVAEPGIHAGDDDRPSGQSGELMGVLVLLRGRQPSADLDGNPHGEQQEPADRRKPVPCEHL